MLSGSDSASSLPLPDPDTAQSSIRSQAAASINESQQMGAPDQKSVKETESAAHSENDAAAANAGVTGRPASHASADGGSVDRNGGAAAGGSSGERVRHGESGGAGREGARGEVRYFEKKKAPALTGWWESAAAFSAVMLLPLISVVPCSTTAVREDDVVV